MSARPKRLRIPPQKTAQSRALRRDSTFPERLLWSYLRAGRLQGVKFRRQHACGPYVVDFYCAAAQLVIEIDGLSHDGRQQYDADRTRYLETQGLTVVRYLNDQIIADVETVVADIFRQISSRLS